MKKVLEKISLFLLIVLLSSALTTSPSMQSQCPSNEWLPTIINNPSCQPINTIIISGSYDPQQHLNQISTPPSNAVSTGYSTNLGGTPTPYDSIIQDCASQFNVNPNLVKAIIRVESNFNPNAVSSAGAEGLMQLMPATFNSLSSGDILDPRTNVCAGTEYLSQMLNMFSGNMQLAEAAYNAGPGAVQKYHNNIPNYPETQNYVTSVTSAYNVYNA
jgi:soluble lytic murein transglycosylase-like protein